MPPRFPILKVRIEGEAKMVNSVMRGVPSVGYAISASRAGRVSLPVAPSSVIYSQFKHVSGVPASEGSGGVSISKLKILDVLMEQLAQIKKDGGRGAIPGAAQLGEQDFGALVESLGRELQTAKASNRATPYAAAAAAPAGVLFNLTA